MFALLLIVVFIAEVTLSGLWAPAYFRYGVPIFRMELGDAVPRAAVVLEMLQQRFNGPRAFFAFEMLDDSSVAIRDSWASLSTYTPVMHGMIRDSADGKPAHIIGYLNWTPVAVLCLFGFGTPDAHGRWIGVLVLVIFAGTYVVEARRYAKIARFLLTEGAASEAADLTQRGDS